MSKTKILQTSKKIDSRSYQTKKNYNIKGNNTKIKQFKV